jgi:hypothetical protein
MRFYENDSKGRHCLSLSDDALTPIGPMRYHVAARQLNACLGSATPVGATHRKVIMPKGPQGQKRPADAIARAVMIAKIATGEVADTHTDQAKALHSKGGKIGGKARASALTPERRTEIAKKAASSRWRGRPHD